MKLTAEQYAALLKPLAKHRISSRQQGGMHLSYLEAWDVKAHLIRVFGFTGWSADVISAELAFEDKDDKGRWNVGYKVVMRLRIHGQEGDLFGDTTYTEAAVGSATLPQRGEAHDMAVKTAESDALKRAAINLGTQFGLSLYDGGNRNDVVGHTLAPPDGYQVAEVKFVSPPDAVYGLVNDARAATTEEALKVIWDRIAEMNELDSLLVEGDDATPRSIIFDLLVEMREKAEA
jgi:hypothetical protein